MNGRFIRRALTTVALSVALIPLHNLPASATPQSTAKPDASKLAPLGGGKNKTVTPTSQSGNFSNAPDQNFLADNAGKTSGTAFDPSKSKLTSQNETTDFYTNTDGSTTARLHQAPVNWQDSKGSWHKIDNTLSVGSDKRLHNASGPVDVSIANSSDDSDLVSLTNGGNSVTLTPTGAVKGKTPKVNRNTDASFDGLLNGATVDESVEAGGIKETITLASKPADTSNVSFHFDLKAKGLTAVTQSDGSIVLNDKSGVAVFTIPQGLAWDSSPNADNAQVPVAVTLSSNGKGIDITPTASWLNTATYPVYIDPQVHWYAGYQSGHWDAYTSSAYPNNNYNGPAQIDNNAYVDKVGYDNFPSSQYYSFMKFDTSFLNGKHIDSAYLNYVALTYDQYDPNAHLHFYPLGQDWTDSGVTWNTMPNYMNVNTVTVDPSNLGGYSYFNATTWIANWTSGVWPNYGISIDTGGGDLYARLASMESWSYNPRTDPDLDITYDDNPPTAPVPTAPAVGANLMTTTPTLSANPSTDPDGDPVQYWFRVSDTSTPDQGQVINSGWLNSPTWTIPPGSLQDGVTYSWYVMASDAPGGGAGTSYSAVQNFKVNLRLGAQTASPTDTEGPITVNLANGNVSYSTSSPTMSTVGGPVGLSYTYNSQTPVTTGLNGRYWSSGSCDAYGTVSGSPQMTRTDPTVSFNWGGNGPGGAISNINFCAQWDGFITAPVAGQYCFAGTSDDGSRAYINSQLVVDMYDQGGVSRGTPNACINLSTTPVAIHEDYFNAAGNANVQLLVSGPTTGLQPLPSSWLTTTFAPLPTGWHLSANTEEAESYDKAVISDASVVLVDPTGGTHEYKKTGLAGAAGFTPPADERTTLSIVPGSNPPQYLAQGDDGMAYTFDSTGALISVASSNDDKSPAAANYIYTQVSGLARLTTIQDPVSGRQITLKYSTGGAGSPCANAPAGFSSQGPAGMLCEIDYPDLTATVFYYSASDRTGQLMRIVDPGSETTDFGYGATGLMTGTSDPMQMDYRVGHPSNLGGYTTINYDGAGRATSVVLASPDGSDGTSAPPTTNRPWHSYNYVTPFSIPAGGETRTAVGGLSPAQGFATDAVFNQYAQTTSTTDSSGVTTTNTYDPADHLLSTVNGGTGLESTTLWDSQRDIQTDQYGPAPTSCFTGQTPNGSCTSPTVSHTHTDYDEGINGLAISWWTNPNLIGAAAAHSTSIRNEDTGGQIDENWGAGGPNILGGQADNFSLRATGDIHLYATGAYNICLAVDEGARLWIDNMSIIDSWTVGGAIPQRCGTFTNTTIGWHSIRLEMYEGTNIASLSLLTTPPSGTQSVVSATDLRPDYNLATTSTTDDSTTGSPTSVTKTNYGSVGGTFDPAYGIALSTTVDPSGQNLTTSNSYEAPRTTGQYMRPLSKTLPAGNTSTTTYYTGTQTVTNPCTATTSVVQSGLAATSTDPTPASGSAIVTHTVYDIMGRTIASWTNSDSPTCTTYDARGRVLTVAYPANGSAPARTVTNVYVDSTDNNSPLTSTVTDAAGTIKTTVDMLGRTVAYTDVWGRTTTTAYNLAGMETSSTAPNDYRATTYDSAGRPSGQSIGTSVATAKPVATSTYDATSSRLTHVDYPSGTGNVGNGTSVDLGYATMGGQNNSLTYKKAGTSFDSDAVTYSQSGRITDESIDGTDANTSGGNFVYDAAGRLTDAYVTGHHYSYAFVASAGCGADTAAGKNTNRTSLTDNGTTAATYCYDNADRLTSTTDARYSSIAYDAHGNTTSMGGSTMTYDIADRHLSSTTGSDTVTYTRDATGRIVERKETGAPSLRSVSSANNGTGATSLSIAMPAGAQTGDVLLAQVATNAGTSATITPPTGWTQVSNRTNADLIHANIYWHTVAVGDPTSFSFTLDSSRQAAGGIAAYSGVNTTSPINGFSSNGSSAATTTFQNFGITTTVANTKLVSFVATEPTTTVTESGLTNRWNVASTGTTSPIQVNMADKSYTGPGASGAVNGTFSTSVNDASQMVALTPALSDVRYAYNDDGDTSEETLDTSSNLVDTTVDLPGGAMMDIRGATTTWQYPNIHGDVMAQADNSGNKIGTTFSYDPFGQSLNGQQPDDESGNMDFGWLGDKERQTEHEGTLNTIEMGQRQYVPGLGRFLQTDPVPGGSANDYDYASGDPVNRFDLDGNSWFSKHWKAIAIVVAVVVVVAVVAIVAPEALVALGSYASDAFQAARIVRAAAMASGDDGGIVASARATRWAGKAWTAGGRSIRASQGAGRVIGRVKGNRVFRSPAIKRSGRLVANFERRAQRSNYHVRVR